ncbi:MAG: hypothetical protein CK425_00690 [Parachlamydia sp.]|nr:MAG: hypothetical protein CK425_00690 [Parachlamydia sp.]
MKLPPFFPKMHLHLEPPPFSRALGEANHGKKTLLWAGAAAVSAVAAVIFLSAFFTVLHAPLPVPTPLLVAMPLIAIAITSFALYIFSLFAFFYATATCLTCVYRLFTEAPIRLH